PDAVDPLAIDPIPVVFQHRGNDPIAIHRLFMGIFPDERHGRRFIRAPMRRIPGARPLEVHQFTGMTLRQPSFCHQPLDDGAPGARAYHFFDTTSLRTSMSNACWATIRLRRLFSASNSRKRCSSLVSSPPYLFRHRYTVCSATPCLRQTSATVIPDSTSF